MAVSLTFPTGFKFSYSGDCRPSAAFADIGKDSTVLLHEATFDDELKGDALAKKHSTTSEALGVGMAMGARRVVLTHFSQRYAKIPVMGNVEGVEAVLEEGTGEEGVDGLGMGDEDMVGGDVDAGATLLNGAPEPHESRPQTRSRSPTRALSRHASPVESFVSPKAKDMKVAVAFDYMRVRVGDIAQMEHFTPALLKLYEQEEMDDKVGTIAEVDKEAKAKVAGKAGGKVKEGKGNGKVKGQREDNKGGVGVEGIAGQGKEEVTVAEAMRG